MPAVPSARKCFLQVVVRYHPLLFFTNRLNPNRTLSPSLTELSFSVSPVTPCRLPIKNLRACTVAETCQGVSNPIIVSIPCDKHEYLSVVRLQCSLQTPPRDHAIDIIGRFLWTLDKSLYIVGQGAPEAFSHRDGLVGMTETWQKFSVGSGTLPSRLG